MHKPDLRTCIDDYFVTTDKYYIPCAQQQVPEIALAVEGATIAMRFLHRTGLLRRFLFLVSFREYMLSCVFVLFFEWFWIPSGTCLSIKKLGRHRFGTTCGGHGNMVRKMCDS